MSFADRAELAQELEGNLKHGRAFVKQGEGVAVLADCVLLIVHPEDGAELPLKAQAVMVVDAGPMRGIGLQLRPFDAGVIATVEAFVAGIRGPIVDEAAAAPALPEPIPVAATPGNDGAEAKAKATESDAVDPKVAAGEAADTAVAHADDTDAEDDAQEAEQDANDLQNRPAHHERMRKLSQTEQQKIARTGDLNDRVTLERIYGKHVWEGLLHNPKLSVPEVARIARKGTMPRPLLEYIVENNAWIQAPIVRRALLGNPRVSSEAIMKLLRITPKHELRSIYKTTTYSAAVRECARKVLDA